MNTKSKKELQRELAEVEKHLTALNKRKDELTTLIGRKELILPFCVKRVDNVIMMQGGDNLPDTLYANLHHALTQAGKKVTPLNLTRLWSLYNITKVYMKDRSFGYFTLTTSIGKEWAITINRYGSQQEIKLTRSQGFINHTVMLKYRFTLQDLIYCLDLMNR